MPDAALAAVLLDLDGTLLDTAPDMAGAVNAMLAEDGRAPLPLPVLRPRVSQGSLALLRAAYPGLGAEALAPLQQRFLERYRERLLEQTRAFEGFPPVLEALERAGIPWGIVTNKPGWLTTPLLQGLDLYRRAACVIAGDTVARVKPDPMPLLAAARRMGVAPGRCLYLGDAERDMQAARAAGMVALAARYGYIDPQEDTSHWPVNAWIDSPAQLLAWVGLEAAGAPVRAGADA
jgi:phosphoglycolate phosphatase